MKKLISQLWGLFIFIFIGLIDKVIILAQAYFCTSAAYFFEKGDFEAGQQALVVLWLMIFAEWACAKPKSTKGK